VNNPDIIYMYVLNCIDIINSYPPRKAKEPA
jgi:hypothetical protein